MDIQREFENFEAGCEGRETARDFFEAGWNAARGQQEPVAWGLPNTSLIASQHPFLMVRHEVPSDDQYQGAMWVPLYTTPPAQPVQPAGAQNWEPIETAPKDNKRALYLARFNESGELAELDFNGAWEYWQESWELAHINGYAWASENGIEEPTHWAYQDEALPIAKHPTPAVADFSDAYQGAREDAEIWKKRALEAEELNRKFIADINGHTEQSSTDGQVCYSTTQINRLAFKARAAIAAAEAAKGGV